MFGLMITGEAGLEQKMLHRRSKIPENFRRQLTDSSLKHNMELPSELKSPAALITPLLVAI
jgi:hypothetical protein